MSLATPPISKLPRAGHALRRHHQLGAGQQARHRRGREAVDAQARGGRRRARARHSRHAVVGHRGQLAAPQRGTHRLPHGQAVGALDGVVGDVFAAAGRRFLQHHVDGLGATDAHRRVATRRAEQAQFQFGTGRQTRVGRDFQPVDLRLSHGRPTLGVRGGRQRQRAHADECGGGRMGHQRGGQLQRRGGRAPARRSRSRSGGSESV